jgi:hypothetical protein
MFFESANGAFTCIASMNMWSWKLNIDVIGCHEFQEGIGHWMLCYPDVEDVVVSLVM